MVVLLVCFVASAGYAVKSWKSMYIEDCTIIGTLSTPNGVAITSDVNTKTAAYSVAATDKGKVFDNYGATGSITYTLPAWALGLQYTFTVSTAQSVVINPPDTSIILRLTDAVGDSIWADAAGESVTLVATGISTWVPRELGTWTDAN